MRKKSLLLLLLPLLAMNIYSSSERDNPFRKVAREVIPVVVEINTVTKTEVPSMGGIYDYFFRQTPGEEENEEDKQYFESQGLGSGIVVETDGKKKYVLTNAHVVENADSLSVTFSNEKEYEAEIVGTDKGKDLAVLVFETSDNIPVAKLGNSDDVYIGDWAIAVGSPLGYQSTVSLGIISAVGRPSVKGMEANFTDYIQTDAAINRGNSGGALVNIDGEVIGINTWIASQTGGNIGLGFSVPINNAKNVIRQLIDTGEVEYGWLGVSIMPISESYIKDMKLGDEKGAFIYSVFTDSPADKGGLKSGDYVTSINGKKIDSDKDLLKVVGVLPAGKTSKFELIRDGKPLTLNITTTKRTDERAKARLFTGIYPETLNKEIIDWFNKSPERKINSFTKGVVVAQVFSGSVADITGVKPSDIITHVNGKKISDIRDYYRELGKTEDEAVFTVIRNSQKIKLILMK